MDRIIATKVFINIVESGSMAAAAQNLGMSRSMVTRYLGEIENWAGARLLHRSTRRLSLTPPGEQALEHCKELVKIAEDIPQVVNVVDNTPKGTLRISSSHYAAENILIPALQQYYQDHPKVDIELEIRNDAVNLVEERIDLALRITDTLDPNLIARKLGSCHSVLCAAPSYLKVKQVPQILEDLQTHSCLTYANFEKGLWHFKEGDKISTQKVTGNLKANDSGVLLTATLQGFGISMQPRQVAQPYLDKGELVQVLPNVIPKELGLYGLYQSRQHMPPALRALIDHLVNYTAQLKL